MAHKLYCLEISDVRRETENSVSLAFDVPDDLKEVFTFIPGQYLTLQSEIGGKQVRRSYSICSGLNEPLRVGIKQVQGGKFSTFAQSLKPGDTLEVMPSEGRFTAPVVSTNTNRYLLVAAGSGITPILSIAKSVLAGEPSSFVTLIYGNRTTGSVMFREAIEDLKDQFLGRFHAYHILSGEAQDVDLFSGRIDQMKLQHFMVKEIISPQNCDGIYICGPYAMSMAARDVFIGSGCESSKVHLELFDAPETNGITIPAPLTEDYENGSSIEIILDGTTRKITFRDVGDTVLSAAAKSGLELPFSCSGGMCATCRCKVIEGEVIMAKNYSLADWELEAGFVLGCQSRPKTEKLVLDFDAA